MMMVGIVVMFVVLFNVVLLLVVLVGWMVIGFGMGMIYVSFLVFMFLLLVVYE